MARDIQRLMVGRGRPREPVGAEARSSAARQCLRAKAESFTLSVSTNVPVGPPGARYSMGTEAASGRATSMTGTGCARTAMKCGTTNFQSNLASSVLH